MTVRIPAHIFKRSPYVCTIFSSESGKFLRKNLKKISGIFLLPEKVFKKFAPSLQWNALCIFENTDWFSYYTIFNNSRL